MDLVVVTHACMKANAPHWRTGPINASAGLVSQETIAKEVMEFNLQFFRDACPISTRYFQLGMKGTFYRLRPLVYVLSDNLPGFPMSWAQFHGTAYRKRGTGASCSRKFCVYRRRISQVSEEFRLLRVRILRY